MNRTHSRTKTRLVVFVAVAVVIAVIGAAARQSVTGTPVHTDAATVPSTPGVRASQYANAIEEGRRLAREVVLEENVPGLSVAVGLDGDIVWSEGIGWAEVEHRVPVTPETRFRIGTGSEVLTSAAVGVLLEQGRLTLDDEIHAYVPQLAKTEQPATLRQLIADAGGRGTDAGYDSPLSRRRCERPVDALPHVTDAASNHGFVLVSAAVEAAADQPFLTFMQERIFAPLGMNATFAESPTEENPDHIGEPGEDFPGFTLVREVVLEPLGIADRRPVMRDRATLYARGSGGNLRGLMQPAYRHRLHEIRLGNLSCYAGAMAFLSTPSDLVRFGLALDNGTLLQPATIEVLRTIPAQAAGHDGELRGQKVMSLLTVPERGIVVAVTANSSYAGASSLAAKIAELFTSR